MNDSVKQQAKTKGTERQSRIEKLFMNNCLDKLYQAMDKNIYISSLRHGLSLSIPFFLFGSLALVLLHLPIPFYQQFLKSFLDGELVTIFLWLFYSSMGILSLIMLVSVSYSFGKLADPGRSGIYPLTCMISYFVFCIDENSRVEFEMFNSDWLFTTCIITLCCCSLLRKLLKASQKLHDRHYHEGIDLDFQNVMVSLIPIAGCVIVFLVVKLIMIHLIGSVSLQNIGSDIFTVLFENIGTGVGGAILFIFLIHILWFFGIHGSNMLNMVSVSMFEVGMAANVAAVSAGQEPSCLFTKTFFDCFILMGGSGATLCLLLAMLIGNRRSNSKSLFRCALIPSIFNVNELVLFGLPVVFNPIMLIPFLLVPLVLLGTSALSMYLGLVPYCTNEVIWTIPILLSGYQSTGSIAGSVLQLVNLVIGAAIYLPFIRLSEQYYSGYLKQNVNQLRSTIMDREEIGDTSSLHSPQYRDLQDVIKLMTADLRHALNNRKISLYYQPQFNIDGTLHGVEALLRWNHPSLGFLYPPMVIELAREDGILQKMGYQIIETGACALERLSQETKYPIDLAVNISPVQLEDPTFCGTVQEILSRHDFHGSKLCFEVTEQIALGSTELVRKRMDQIHEMGIAFHMDDFGMGHSSMTYLQYGVFDTVKLDGSLVKDMEKNPRTREIIAGIAQMSEALNYDIVAEFVETAEQRAMLNDLGCHIYQGYLYSPALELNRLETYLKEESVIDQLLKTKPTDADLYL